jgi:hypothetical protein
MGVAFFKNIDMTSLESLTDCLSESAVCLLTGSSENLTHIAVDSNLRNIMPDNIALISKDIVNEILPVYEYSMSVGSCRILFETGNVFETYNIAIVEGIKNTSPEIFNPVLDYNDIFKVWETLATRHCKGISKITVEGPQVTYGLDKVSALQALTVSKVRNKNESNIVSPSGESAYSGSKIKIVQ